MFLIGSSAVGNLYTCCYLLNNRVICPSLQFWLKKKGKKKLNNKKEPSSPATLSCWNLAAKFKNTAAVIYQILQYSSKAR